MTDYNPFSLKGKNVLITGASSGIGQTTAIECSRLGARVIITGRNAERLMETYELLDGDGHTHITADLTIQEDIDKIVSSIEPIDGLVNNAGLLGKTKPVNFIKQEDLDKLYQTNVFSSILLTKSLLKGKKISNGASMVFTSSLSAQLSAPGIAVYASTKAAVTAYMRTCALELGERKIRANAVLPGMVETDLIANNTYSSADFERDKELYALRRYGNPNDVAHAIIYLLSDASSWVTGTSLVVDGGRSLK